MRIIEFRCEAAYPNVKFVLKNIMKISTSLIIKLKQSNGILVNDAVVNVLFPLDRGDIIKLIIPYSDNGSIESSDLPINVLYEDEDVICIDKPCGMPTHPSVGHHGDTLVNAALNRLRKNSDEFHVVTRLDRYTSGVVLAAKNQFSASKMCTDSYNRSIVKKYVGVCRGYFQSESGVVEFPIARCAESVIKRCVSPDGKYARTSYTVLEQKNNTALVEFELHTGRTHQIRVHASHIGHPLINDFLYDECADEEYTHKLHCTWIEFVHPFTSCPVSVKAPLPADFF